MKWGAEVFFFSQKVFNRKSLHMFRKLYGEITGAIRQIPICRVR